MELLGKSETPIKVREPSTAIAKKKPKNVRDLCRAGTDTRKDRGLPFPLKKTMVKSSEARVVSRLEFGSSCKGASLSCLCYGMTRFFVNSRLIEWAISKVVFQWGKE